MAWSIVTKLFAQLRLLRVKDEVQNSLFVFTRFSSTTTATPGMFRWVVFALSTRGIGIRTLSCTPITLILLLLLFFGFSPVLACMLFFLFTLFCLPALILYQHADQPRIAGIDCLQHCSCCRFGRLVHTTAVCVFVRWSGLHMARLSTGSFHGLPRW